MKNFPFTTLCIALIFVLSFFNPPQTPLDGVAFIDKWTHLVMYGGTVGMFWVEYWHAHWKRGYVLSRRTLVVVALVVPLLLGGLIEILQAYCTDGRRSGEWMDWTADNIGVVVAYIAGCTLVKRIAKKLWHKGEA
jgi:VanZ family protein